ncbi:hypothetical protein G647_05748 [Cladophialophora carrionii CBS 160.54]|uniref:Uncharacterized protein n=1 Tax=Cladophialophora carrionii CBS 160.54 TaxID=1279043 RepID=V9DB86_9EURO|nr:uncharacterized protein G647_05748 [Cladophialophora carrionii CBS 160.54]ETI23941.1 hypothetical protein G647_05748 [Cladophialophora carrionii CBS 160.54]
MDLIERSKPFNTCPMYTCGCDEKYGLDDALNAYRILKGKDASMVCFYHGPRTCANCRTLPTVLSPKKFFDRITPDAGKVSSPMAALRR